MRSNTPSLPSHMTKMAVTPALSSFNKKLAGVAFLLLLLAGCANYGTPKNTPVPESHIDESYSLHDWVMKHNDNEIRLILSFSGGGTRAAALSYGVMQELRDTMIESNGKTVRLLDEVDYISSVSGGSFTSAYYGLHGDGLFENFEDDFLRFNLEKHLILRTINPLLLFSKKGRTESAISYYQKFLFHDATFGDMIHPQRPIIIINASDLGRGIRFSFIQEYFDLLCSELADYPVADAVAASSAVPVLFNPIVVKNYDTCSGMNLRGAQSLVEAEEYYEGRNLPTIVSQLKSYGDKDNRKFIHFVDGGITDNLGLRAITDILAVSGNPSKIYTGDRRPPRHVVVIGVDAATASAEDMDKSNKQPSAVRMAGAVTNLQLIRYDVDSKLLVENVLTTWADKLSTPERPVNTHLISVSIQDVEEPSKLRFFNEVPTSFALDDEQVDGLIAAGRELLRNNPEFQELLTQLNGRLEEK